MEINGKTKVCGVIGDPISHTLSPKIHNMLASCTNNNFAYLPFHVEEQNLECAIKGAFSLGICGLNVTTPHKKNIMPFLYKLDDSAMKALAVNTIKYTKDGYIGYNTDWIGLSRTLEKNNVSVSKKDVVVLGAGGSSYAAVVSAINSGASKIFVVNRNIQTAIKLALHFKDNCNANIDVLDYSRLSEIKNVDILIQTTSVGFSKQEQLSPINDLSFFKKVKVAIDFIYNPWETKFLKDAKSFGCYAINGFDILFFQAVAAYEIFNDLTVCKNVIDEIYKQLWYTILDFCASKMIVFLKQ